MSDFTATYSPDDNKLRLYSVHRLDPDTYAEAKAAGFKWAPKQELFVAPMWTPEREDFLLKLAGEIGDEDTSLTERAEERADRFEDYSEKRADEASRAHEYVREIAGGIPLGQPILIGHHSQRHAEKHAKQIENGMRRAVNLWKTSEYWERRAAGAIAHAKYKERADVRARRIKTIEADKRKAERSRNDAAKWLAAWSKDGLTMEEAISIANICWLHLPRKEGDRPDFDQAPTAYTALTNDYPNLYAPRTLEEVIAAAKKTYPAAIAHYDRWIQHYENRLAYERAMLSDQGGTVSDQTALEVGGAVRCLWAPRGGWAYIKKVNKVTVTIHHKWNEGGRVFSHNEKLDKIKEIMTRAQVEEKRALGLLQEVSDERGFYLLDSPPPQAPKKEETTQDQKTFEAMEESLRAGVQTVSANQLFPTPRNIAERMADMLDVQPGERVLEPSAGTGELLRVLPDHCESVAVELNRNLAGRLSAFDEPWPHLVSVWACKNFLEMLPSHTRPFDKVIMNPPFENASDIKHIKHALTFLKPGGRLVAICADGPRQREALRSLVDHWEELPAGTFEGTNVRTVLLTINV